MFIDMNPPAHPEPGDVWIRLGEARVWWGEWEPPWAPPEDPIMAIYPKPGWRKGKRRNGINRNRNKKKKVSLADTIVDTDISTTDIIEIRRREVRKIA